MNSGDAGAKSGYYGEIPQRNVLPYIGFCSYSERYKCNYFYYIGLWRKCARNRLRAESGMGERAVRKLSLTLLILAATLAGAPAALADSYIFIYTGNVSNYSTGLYYPADEITINGVFTTSGAANADGGIDITSFTGTYTDTEDGVSGEISLYSGNGTYENYLTSANDSWLYDNLYYPNENAPGTTGGQFDYYGLLLNIGTSSDPAEWEVNFWADSSTTYVLVESEAEPGQDYLNQSNGIGITNSGSFSNSPGPVIARTPEPGSLLLLGTGLLGLAVMLFLKAKPSDQDLDR